VAYVGNVAFDANQEQLKEVFEGCEVKIIRLHTDKDTGKSKGYAHVHFADEDSLDRCELALSLLCFSLPPWIAGENDFSSTSLQDFSLWFLYSNF
jgi:RNA recognition motif-containing protein